MRRSHPILPQSKTNGQLDLGVALAAVLSIATGTIFAQAFVPYDLSDPEGLFWPSVYMTLGLLLPLALRVRFDLRFSLRIENAIMVGLVYWLMLDMLQSAYAFDWVSDADVRIAYITVGVFAAAVWIGASGRGWRLPNSVTKAASKDFSNRMLFSALLLAFALGMAKFAIGAGFDPLVMIQGLGVPRWSAPWSRGQFGGSEAFLDHMQYFGYVVPSLTVLLVTRTGALDKRAIFGVVLSAVMIAFLAQGGGRRVIGVAVGAALMTWVAANPRLRPQLLIATVIGAAVLLTGLQEMLRYRNVGFAAWWAGERPELNYEHLHVDDNFLRLSQLIHFYPEKVDYVYHQPLYHALTLPIPRVIWTGKPLGPGFDPASLVGKEGVALTSSIIGELWVSFGMLAVVAGGFVIGRLAGMWNKILFLPSGTSRPLIFGLGLMVIFAGLRSVQAFVQMSYIILAWIVISNFLMRQRSKPATRPR